MSTGFLPSTHTLGEFKVTFHITADNCGTNTSIDFHSWMASVRRLSDRIGRAFHETFQRIRMEDWAQRQAELAYELNELQHKLSAQERRALHYHRMYEPRSLKLQPLPRRPPGHQLNRVANPAASVRALAQRVK